MQLLITITVLRNFYLWDGMNTRIYVDLFVKYEIWPNLLSEIKRRKAKAILISALFRETQSFFKWYGKFMRNALKAFQYIFTQDEKSKFNLLDWNSENSNR